VDALRLELLQPVLNSDKETLRESRSHRQGAQYDRAIAQSRRAPANSSREVALSRDQIVSAAVEWIDREGIQAFSMRRLAADLGISGPALYWHFRGRDELLGEATRAVLEEAHTAGPKRRERWDRAVRRILTSVWQLADAHPGLTEMLRTQPLHTASGQRIIQSLLVALRGAGFPPDAAVVHARSLLWTTFGFIRSTAATLERVPEGRGSRVVTLQIDDGDQASFALIADCVPHLAELDIDVLFAHTLDLLLAGITADLARRVRD